MKSFLLILGFFTRLPVPKTEFTEERYLKAVKLMPLVGLVIGAILVLAAFLLSLLAVPALIRGAIVLCVYIFLTGGLHFDGLADACDGVFSGRNREQALNIMKDSRIGVFGTLGIFLTGLFYFALFSEVHITAILVFPVVGRACCLISASLAPYARPDGMGKTTGKAGGPLSVAAAIVSVFGASILTLPLYMLFAEAGERSAALLAVVPFVCSLLAGVAAIIVTACFTATLKKRLGGVTGDTFGAVIEISSIVYLLVFLLLFA